MITFTLNNEKVSVEANGTERLLDILREQFGLMGSKEGCGEGECGACSVLINGDLKTSCLIPIGTIEGDEVLTIEGYELTKKFEVMNECYGKAGAVQCGYCTPGMMMASEALLLKNPHPTEADIREAISGNLCRCTGYNMIVEAIKNTAKLGEGLWA